jgi:hypothetical protein
VGRKPWRSQKARPLGVGLEARRGRGWGRAAARASVSTWARKPAAKAVAAQARGEDHQPQIGIPRRRKAEAELGKSRQPPVMVTGQDDGESGRVAWPGGPSGEEVLLPPDGPGASPSAMQPVIGGLSPERRRQAAWSACGGRGCGSWAADMRRISRSRAAGGLGASAPHRRGCAPSSARASGRVRGDAALPRHRPHPLPVI